MPASSGLSELSRGLIAAGVLRARGIPDDRCDQPCTSIQCRHFCEAADDMSSNWRETWFNGAADCRLRGRRNHLCVLPGLCRCREGRATEISCDRALRPRRMTASQWSGTFLMFLER